MAAYYFSCLLYTSLQLFGTQILEQQIQLRQGVGNGRSRKERRAEIAPRALLNGDVYKRQVKHGGKIYYSRSRVLEALRNEPHTTSTNKVKKS